MAITTSILTGGSNSHTTTSEEVNYHATDFFSDGVVGATTATSGVAPMTGAFNVNAQGSPNMTVAVGTGVAYVTATPSGGNSQRLRIKNSASANVTIAANASGGTRYDWVYLSVDATKAATPALDASDVTTLVTSRSTSNTTDNGTPPTYGLVLAVVTVVNGAASISNGSIADKRVQSGATVSDNGASLQTYRSEMTFDYVASGCVLSGTGYGTTLAWSMTSGVVYIGGRRLTVASASGTVTASKDTYFDLLDPGTGTTATLVNTSGNIVTNNAASPALAASSVRIGIIVSGAGSIAAATSVNQGQETMLLPIASSIPYQVTDSLGNLICPRDPNRKVLGQRMVVADQSSTTTTAATATNVLVDCPVIVPTGRKVKVTLSSYYVKNSTATAQVTACIWDGNIGSGTEIAEGTFFAPTNGYGVPMTIDTGAITPSTTSKTYKGGLFVSANTGTFSAKATAPGVLKVELA